METWHSEYLDLMFGKDRTSETMNKAALLKFQHMPETVFKYRSFSKNSMSALKEDCLFSSSPKWLNDIREAPISFVSDKIKASVVQDVYNDARKHDPRLPEAVVRNEYELAAVFRALSGNPGFPEPQNDAFINELVAWCNKVYDALLGGHIGNLRNMYNVCCFSASGTEDLMWSHYADSHKGFCIEYDFKSLGITNEDVQLLLPVVYIDTPHIQMDDLDAADGSLLMYAMSLKRSSWGYEQEWRRFYPHTDEPNPEKMPNPVGIYLGTRCSDQNKEQMMEICKDKEIPLFQMTLKSFGSTITPERIL